MFKKYIRNIVKEEINDIKLENTLKQLRSEHYWRDKAESEIKHREFLVNHKNQIIIGLDEENEDLKQENEKLKKELVDSKNGLNGANHVIKNNKEWIKSQDKKIKELEEENRHIKSQLSNNIYFNLYQKQVERTEILVKEKDKEIEELKDLYEKERNKNYKTLESEELKQKNKKLKEIIENLEDNLIIKGNLLSEQKEENEKLKIKVDEYYNKFLSEGIKKEKAQELIRKVKKEIVLQGFDQDDFFSPEQIFYRIKNILKES